MVWRDIGLGVPGVLWGEEAGLGEIWGAGREAWWKVGILGVLGTREVGREGLAR